MTKQKEVRAALTRVSALLEKVEASTKVAAAMEEALETADPRVLKILESIGYEPTDYWDGLHGNILNAKNIKTTRDGKRLSLDKMKKLLSIPGLRWVEASKDSISIGL